MSRWSKRSEEEKRRILQNSQRTFYNKSYTQLSYEQIRGACDKAKHLAGHDGAHCSACDLRCPGCPLESAWPKEQKSV